MVFPFRSESYTRSGILLKTAEFSNFVINPDGSNYATRIRIKSALNPGFYSLIQISDLKIRDDLPDYYHVGVGSTAREVIRRLSIQPDNAWWDDPSTSEKEVLEDIFRLTFEESVQELRKELGKDLSVWQWGDLHTITFENQVMNSFPFIKTVFNRGPFPASGGSAIINATGWDPSNPYVINWLPSKRMIVDLNDLSDSVSIHTTGQSGHAYHPHYIDMADLWRKIYYHPMLWTSGQTQNQNESLLILTP